MLLFLALGVVVITAAPLESLINQKAALNVPHVVKPTADFVTETITQNGVVWNRVIDPILSQYAVRYRTIKPDSIASCDPTVKQIAGYLDVGSGKHLFFWLFESRRSPSRDPLVLWLNGGPGSSSLFGMFGELGPCTVANDSKTTVLNPWAWNNEANTVFLEQPVPTGFSYSDSEDMPNTSDDTARDMVAFLRLLYQAFPTLAKVPLHLTGESYAGHFIPALGHAILEHNLKESQSKLNLATVAIGNPWTKMTTLFESVPDFLSFGQYGELLPTQSVAQIRQGMPECLLLLKSCQLARHAIACQPALTYCEGLAYEPVEKSGLNVFDVRHRCEQDQCYPSESYMLNYLNRPDVQQALGVNRQWQQGSGAVYKRYRESGDFMFSLDHYVEELLENGLRVLIYAGDADSVCNWIGTKRMTTEFKWKHAAEFNDAADLQWVSSVTGLNAGEIRTFGPLTFIRFFEAGHMVPTDQPKHAFEMISMWLRPSL
ncbi:putative carboxypeptidase C [Cladochytrium replicatum]|nr:putative carboxypeptidase C [Cladochytrium replicatum]